MAFISYLRSHHLIFLKLKKNIKTKHFSLLSLLTFYRDKRNIPKGEKKKKKHSFLYIETQHKSRFYLIFLLMLSLTFKYMTVMVVVYVNLFHSFLLLKSIFKMDQRPLLMMTMSTGSFQSPMC